jgi:hypothetical protein
MEKYFVRVMEAACLLFDTLATAGLAVWACGSARREHVSVARKQ